MKVIGGRAAQKIALTVVGWLLILVGIAALVLPGPGLLALFAGMAILATQYEWAERRLEPVKKAALNTAAESVSSPFKIAASILGVLVLISLGLLWGVHPAAPAWWPVENRFWLVGGWGTGGTLIGSGIIAGAMVVYSFIKFRK